ncbi:MAG: radical SAM protein [Nitrospirota bacterium]|nr:radical SAM protein [Nitrospirota bacterium]
MQIPMFSNLPARPPGGTLPVGEELASRSTGVTYEEIGCQKVLCPSPAAQKGGYPFSWTINPYRGCEIGCVYCYARYTHGYLGADPQDFAHRIFIKLGAERGVAGSLRPPHFAGAEIAIGTATDPYQPAERSYRLTRRILQRLAAFSGLTLSITTKSPLVTDDTDLLAAIGRRSRLTVHMSLISLDASLIRHLEPKAATPEARLEAVRRLADAGVRVGLFRMPVIPGLTDSPDQAQALDAAARAAGAAYVISQELSLRDDAWPVLAVALQTHYPRIYPEISRRMAARMAARGRQHKAPSATTPPCPDTPSGATLFG